jgi:dihydrofolate reductase
MNTRKLIVYIAKSLDGYIAGPNDDLSFLSMVAQEGEDYGYGDFIKEVDTVIIGRKTYDWVMTQVPEFPHADKEAYVITRTERAATGNTQFYTGELNRLVKQLKAREGKNIFVDGGAEVIAALLKEGLIDEWYISVIPILLGQGVRLFKDSSPQKKLQLLQSKQFPTGLVQLHYKTIHP